MFDLNNHTPKKLSHSVFSGPPRKVKSKAQEHRVAKLGGGRRQPASGAGRAPTAKGDVRGVKNYLIECKRTDYAWIYVEPSVFPKIEREASRLGKTALVQLDIDGRRPSEIRSWYLKPGVVADKPGVVVKTTKGSGLNLTTTNLRRMDAIVASGALPQLQLGRPKDTASIMLGGSATQLWTAFPESMAKDHLGI